ncbi:MAG: hypothetical protein WA040_18305 [Anaerolineae bacterium]
MTRISNTNTVVCDGCGVEIAWAAFVLGDKTFCCVDCAEGRDCECDYPPQESPTAGQQQPTLAVVASYA